MSCQPSRPVDQHFHASIQFAPPRFHRVRKHRLCLTGTRIHGDTTGVNAMAGQIRLHRVRARVPEHHIRGWIANVVRMTH